MSCDPKNIILKAETKKKQIKKYFNRKKVVYETGHWGGIRPFNHLAVYFECEQNNKNNKSFSGFKTVTGWFYEQKKMD